MKQAIKSYGVDATSGKNEGDGETQPDTSNYEHIESFVKDLQHPHELHHAMYHAAKRLVDKDGDTDNLNESLTGSEHDMTQPISMSDYQKLKSSY